MVVLRSNMGRGRDHLDKPENADHSTHVGGGFALLEAMTAAAAHHSHPIPQHSTVTNQAC